MTAAGTIAVIERVALRARKISRNARPGSRNGGGIMHGANGVDIWTERGLIAILWRRYGEGRGRHRRVCQSCGRAFFCIRPEATYCRPACRQRAYRRRCRADQRVR